MINVIRNDIYFKIECSHLNIIFEYPTTGTFCEPNLLSITKINVVPRIKVNAILSLSFSKK